MTRQVYAFEDPERFVIGTVGQPGERTFFLQVRGPVPDLPGGRPGARTVSVALEKQQVFVLAEKLDELLSEVRRRFDLEVPETVPHEEQDFEPLDIPVDEEFRVGSMGLAYNGESERVIIEAHAITQGDEPTPPPLSDTPEGPDVLRVSLRPQVVRAFVDRARRVLAAGRPPCPLCGLPLEVEGHICPRHNGYRRRP